MLPVMRPVATILLAGALLAGGCARPPDEATAQVRAGLEAVRQADAHLWAAEELASAEAAVAAAEAEVLLQKQKLAPGRSYDRARLLLREAERDISFAREAAAAGRKLAEEEAREAVTTAEAAVHGAQTALMLAPVSSSHSFDRLDEALEQAGGILDDARGLLEEGRYRDATQRAEEVMTLVSERIRTVRRSNGS
jgi:hypothetical protein